MPEPCSMWRSLPDLSCTAHSRRCWSALTMKNAVILVAMVMVSFFAWGQNLPDREIADKVFSMANQVRVAAGLPALKADPRINDAATLHVVEFAKDGHPADQYGDEPWLMERLRMAEVRAGAAGEILLSVPDVDHVPEQMKTAEPVRNTLLNPKFTLAGFAVLRGGPQLYIVGNLVQLLEDLSIEQVEDLVVDTVQHRRMAVKIMPFKVIPMHQLRERACGMVKKDSLKATPVDPYLDKFPAPPSRDFRILAFTASDPRVLSDTIRGPADDPKLNALSVGVCFGSSKTYPTGTYWIVLEFYNFMSGPRE